MSRQPHRVSILIPAFNADQYIAQAIESALNQTWQNIEVIVVDDGSNDNTLAVAEQFKNHGLKIFSQSNKGASAARNLAFRQSSGDFVQYLDADDALALDKIERQMALATKFGAEFLYSAAWGVFYDTVNNAVFRPSSLWKDYDDPPQWLTTAWRNQIWMQPAVWLTSRQIIEKAGEWNESLSLHDDGEFFCRVILQSKGIRHVDDARIFYRSGISTSLSQNFSRRAIESHLKICGLYEKYLLAVNDSEDARKACAANYINFNYVYYPKFKSLRDKALERAKLLAGDFTVEPNGTELFQLLRPVLGWKLARKIEYFYYSNGLNRRALKKKLFG